MAVPLNTAVTCPPSGLVQVDDGQMQAAAQTSAERRPPSAHHHPRPRLASPVQPGSSTARFQVRAGGCLLEQRSQGLGGAGWQSKHAGLEALPGLAVIAQFLQQQ